MNTQHFCFRAPARWASLTVISALLVSASFLSNLPAADKEKGDAPEAKNLFAYRTGEERERLIKEGGGNAQSEAAVAAALKWLARHQTKDGHWGLHDFATAGRCNCSGPGSQNDTAGTALGLLPFLGAGETHKGNGAYSKNIQSALKWLVNHQAADTAFGTGYSQALCTIALCEAYGLTGDENLKRPAQKALNACVAWQNEKGGFRYASRDPGDTSVTGWFIQALKAGQMVGLNVPNGALKNGNQFLDSVATPGGDKYTYQAGNEPTPAMTAAGLLSRENLGWDTKKPALIKGLEFLNSTARL